MYGFILVAGGLGLTCALEHCTKTPLAPCSQEQEVEMLLNLWSEAELVSCLIHNVFLATI